jgi:organic radical activating enzyme
MNSLPKTFCPAKWDEIFVNLGANYVYACCKSEVVKITKKEDINDALDQQKYNLLNGIQDPACDYCWKIENAGHTSLRQKYLEEFDIDQFDQYKNNQVKPKQVEVSLGNECNFQCTYCNPKFSSQWESDVKHKSYKIFSDQHFYGIDEKNIKNLQDTIAWLGELKTVEKLNILGGEPLQNKNFTSVVNSINSDELGFATNLSFKNTGAIDKVLQLADRYKKISLIVSIDSTEKNAEFSRYGMDYAQMLINIQYLITHAPDNVTIGFNSVMTSITIRDFDNTVKLIDSFYQINPKIIWNLVFCRDPKIFTLNTLPERFKPKILEKIDSLKDRNYIQGLLSLEGAIKSSKFNVTLYNQMKHFLTEFSIRKNISIPVELE